LIKKKLTFVLIALAVLIPTAIGASIQISNMLSGTFSVNGLPFTIGWVNGNPNNSVINAGTTTTCEIYILNRTPESYPDACIVLQINTPSSLWQFDVNEVTPTALPADEYLSATVVYYTMPIAIPANFDGLMTFEIVCGENCAPGNYQFNMEAYSEPPFSL
jgi:hypothetical protein